jgi:phosphohistidine phosphatase
MAWLGIVPDELRCSPFARTQQTAALLGAVLAPKLSIKPCPELAPGHNPDEVLTALMPNPNSQHVMLVGHEPDLSRLASYVMTGAPDVVPMPFKKGSVAAIELPSLSPRSLGRLVWFSTPKQLRALGELVTRPRTKQP